jgi:ribosome recycling factor
MDKHINTLKEEFTIAVEHLRVELAKVHTGRASAGLIEELSVDYFGAQTPLRSLASITVTAPREMKIEVWDVNAAKAVAATLTKASLGSLPQVEGRVIRLNLPSMTGETRERMIKIVHELLEKAKISLRNSRESIWNKIQDQEKAGEIREDDKFRLKDDIQKLIDEYNKKVDEVGGRKEEELKV